MATTTSEADQLKVISDDLKGYLAKDPTGNLADFIAWVDKAGGLKLTQRDKDMVYAGTAYSRYQKAKARGLVDPVIRPAKKAPAKKAAPAKATAHPAPKPGPVATPPAQEAVAS